MNKLTYFVKVSLVFCCSVCFFACEDVRIEKYPNGKIHFESRYVDDKKEGLEKEFYESGVLKRESSYKNDKREGVTFEYYENGILKSETPYEDGYVTGEVKRYHNNEKLAFKAKFEKNKQIEIGEHYKENGEKETSGTYKDPRDGYNYEWILIGTQLWIAENLNYAPASGSLCLQCNNWGRLYNFESAKNACMEGFHIPTKAEWEVLLKEAGEKPGRSLKSGFGWDPVKQANDYGNGLDDFGMGIKSGGAHFAKSDVPIKERKFDGAGKKAYLWTAEGNVLVFFHNKDMAQFEKFNLEYGASLRCLKD